MNSQKILSRQWLRSADIKAIKRERGECLYDSCTRKAVRGYCGVHKLYMREANARFKARRALVAGMPGTD